MEEAYIKFDGEHPEVWSYFVTFTLQLINKGLPHYSSSAVLARIRWEVDLEYYHSRKMFKINNNHNSFYAIRFNEMFPRDDDFYILRDKPSKYEPATTLPPLVPEDYT